MQRTLTKIAIAFFMCLFLNTSFAFGQTESNWQSSFAFSNVSNVVIFPLKAEFEGKYTVSIYGPNAEVVTRPLKEKPLAGGTIHNVKFDTQFWALGTYTMVVMRDERTISSQRFRILP